MTVTNNEFWLKEKELTTPIHDEMVIYVFDHFKEILNEVGIEKNFEYNPEKILEFPILNGYNNNIGYIDLKISYKLTDKEFQYNWANSQERVTRSNGAYSEVPAYNVYFEIKPEVKSIGEVLRQFQFYKTHLKGEFVLVTKTKGLKEIFKSQGIKVYYYLGEYDALCTPKMLEAAEENEEECKKLGYIK